MNWATQWIERLRIGETVQFRPRGNSMTPHIESGQLVTVKPERAFRPGDIVLCTVGPDDFLRFVGATDGVRCLIKNARGRINGWMPVDSVYGRCVKVEP